MRRIELKVDGQRLVATLFEPQQPNGRGVLFFNGWRSEQTGYEMYAEALSASGFVAMIFDMRGVGKSEGDITRLSRGDFLKDCLATFDCLNEIVQDITIIGSSFGGYLACLVGAEREAALLVLRAPANYPDETFSEPQSSYSDALDREGWQFDGQQFPDSIPMQSLRKFAGPILLVASGDDKVIHRDTIQNYRNAASMHGNLSYVEMKGAPHALVDANVKIEYCNILTTWIASCGGSAIE